MKTVAALIGIACACSSKDAKQEAPKPQPAAAAPAAVNTPTALADWGITADLPAGATARKTSDDSVEIEGPCEPMLVVLKDTDYDAQYAKAVQFASNMVGPNGAATRVNHMEKRRVDGNGFAVDWQWTVDGVGDYWGSQHVQVIGGKGYGCGGVAQTASAGACMVQICSSLRKRG